MLAVSLLPKKRRMTMRNHENVKDVYNCAEKCESREERGSEDGRERKDEKDVLCPEKVSVEVK